jgi:hypothetical protein
VLAKVKKIFAGARGGGKSKYGLPARQLGDIVRWRERWGVVVKPTYADLPSFDWWIEGEWVRQDGSVDTEISAPFDHNYQGIPDEVLAKATEMLLTA